MKNQCATLNCYFIEKKYIAMNMYSFWKNTSFTIMKEKKKELVII